MEVKSVFFNEKDLTILKNQKIERTGNELSSGIKF